MEKLCTIGAISAFVYTVLNFYCCNFLHFNMAHNFLVTPNFDIKYLLNYSFDWKKYVGFFPSISVQIIKILAISMCNRLSGVIYKMQRISKITFFATRATTAMTTFFCWKLKDTNLPLILILYKNVVLFVIIYLEMKHLHLWMKPLWLPKKSMIMFACNILW